MEEGGKMREGGGQREWLQAATSVRDFSTERLRTQRRDGRSSPLLGDEQRHLKEETLSPEDSPGQRYSASTQTQCTLQWRSGSILELQSSAAQRW